MQNLGELSDTVSTVGGAAEASGAALGILGDIPVFGDAVGEALAGPAAEIEEAGQNAQESAATTRQSVDVLSVLLGLAVALIPIDLAAGALPAGPRLTGPGGPGRRGRAPARLPTTRCSTSSWPGAPRITSRSAASIGSPPSRGASSPRAGSIAWPEPSWNGSGCEDV